MAARQLPESHRSIPLDSGIGSPSPVSPYVMLAAILLSFAVAGATLGSNSLHLCLAGYKPHQTGARRPVTDMFSKMALSVTANRLADGSRMLWCFLVPFACH